MKIGMMSFAHLHAEFYIPYLINRPDVEFLGIADDNLGRGRLFADRYGVKLFDSYDDLLKESPDGVVVCSENNHHRSLVEMAASAGAHVMCEKPLAVDMDDCLAMLDACEKENVRLMTAFPMRYAPPLTEVKGMLDQGGLGKILAMIGSNQGQVPSHHRNWFVNKKLAGGGAILDHTVHLADIYRWYLGCEVTEVYAQSNQIIQAETVDVETGGMLMLQFENGTFASIDCSWSRPVRYNTWGGLDIEIVGEHGVVDVDAFKANLDVHGGYAQHMRLQPCGSDSNGAMVEDFLDSIKENRAPKVSGYDGMKAFEIANAAYQSVLEGQPVHL